MILDVGSGQSPMGTINVDVEKPAFRIPNFVRASGCYLPFKPRTFETVYSSHVIEHSDDPCLFLSELVRVSKRKVIVRCPWWLSMIAKAHGHRWSFTRGWFNLMAKKLSCFPHVVVRIDPDRDLFPVSIEIKAVLNIC